MTKTRTTGRNATVVPLAAAAIGLLTAVYTISHSWGFSPADIRAEEH